MAFAREGADVAIVYLDEHADAEETQRLVEEEGRRALLIAIEHFRHRQPNPRVIAALSLAPVPE